MTIQESIKGLGHLINGEIVRGSSVNGCIKPSLNKDSLIWSMSRPMKFG